MEHFKFKHKFEPLFFWLRVIGLWPNNGSYEFNRYTFYSIFCVGLFIFFNIFFQTMVLFTVELDLSALASVFFLTGHIMIITKVYILLNRLPIIKKLISTLDDPDLQPTNDHHKVAEVDFKLWRILYRVYQTGAAIMVAALILKPLVDGSYQKSFLPYLAWYPFNTTKTPYYQIAYFYQSFGFLFICIAGVTVDTLSIGFTLYLGTQCVILSDKVKQMKNSIDLIKCVEHHRKILGFFNSFASFFGTIVLTQFCGTVTSLTLVLFQLSLTVPGTIDYCTLILMAFLGTLELFLYCWFGNEVELRSSNIPLAIFESEWVGTSPKFQKMLLIFATRTQQPITMTALNLFPLSLRTFMGIMKTCWSYFTVLRQLKSN